MKKKIQTLEDKAGKELEVRPSVEINVKAPACRMKICEDEKTGEIVISYGKDCPKGYIEKVAGKIAVKGVRFRKEGESEQNE